MILHIITGLNDGGAEAVLYNLCIANPERHIVVSMMDEGKFGQLLRDRGVLLHTLNMKQGRLSFAGIFQLVKIILRYKKKIECVQTWMYHANLIGGTVAKLLGVRSVVWGIHHSNLSEGTVKKSTYIVAKICAVLSWFIPTKIISCSYEGVRTHQEIGYDKDKFVVVQNGYDLSKFYSFYVGKTELSSHLDPALPLLGMVARFDVQKDHANLFESLFILKDKGVKFQLVLVGTGMTDDNKKLTDTIVRLNLQYHIFLLGRRNNIPHIMNGMDIHILSSLGEAFPNVIAEAMACGTPCVSTDVGDAKLIIGDTGWVVPPQNSEALALAIEAAVSELQESSVQWQARQTDARKRISDNFEIKKMIDAYDEAWKSV